jgi:succinoglycan biosynthesis protein ExoO
MTDTPDASVIIAAFNAQYHIGGAIASALAQQDVTVEVIVADDASTDETCAVVESIGDPRVVLLKSETNGGPGAARQAAIQAARGNWLAVLDADDRMTPGRLARLLACANDHEADIVADNMQVERAGARSLFIDEVLDGAVERIDLATYAMNNIMFAKGRSYGYLKPVIRARFLRDRDIRYDQSLRIGEDFILIADILAQGGLYVRKRSADYIYTVHAGSISHRLSAANAQAMARADRRFLVRHEAALSPESRRAFAAHLRSLEDGAAFAGMIEAIKARAWGKAGAEALRRPAALRHFWMPIFARLGLRA